MRKADFRCYVGMQVYQLYSSLGTADGERCFETTMPIELVLFRFKIIWSTNGEKEVGIEQVSPVAFFAGLSTNKTSSFPFGNWKISRVSCIRNNRVKALPWSYRQPIRL